MFHRYRVQILDAKNRVIPALLNDEGAFVVPMSRGHDVEYKIRLINNHATRCDATIHVDGKFIGSFRLDPYEEWSIERPSQDKRKFEFHAEESRIAREAGVISGKFSNGLIQVRFVPEHVHHVFHRMFRGMATGARPHMMASAVPESAMYAEEKKSRYSSGATILGGHSRQRFEQVSPLDYDERHAVTITLRLVVDNFSSKSSSGLPTRLMPCGYHTPIARRPDF
jgi:hypothetical protein